MLVDHVDHRQSFHLDATDVVAEEHGLASFAFSGGEDTHLLKEVDVLGAVELVNGVATSIDAPHTALNGLIRPFRIVTVTVENALVVLGQQVLCDGERLLALFEAVSNDTKRFGGDGVQHRVDHGNVLGRAGGAELETVTTVRERRGTVTIFGRHFDRRDGVGAEVERLLLRRVRTKGTILHVVHELRDGRAEVRGHNSRRRFHGAETEVVARGRDGEAHQVTVLVDGGNHSGHDQREDLSVASLRVNLLRVHQVKPIGGTDRPVVVLTGTVDAVERFFLEKRREAVLGGDFFDDLHDHQVLVNLRDRVAEHRGELVLVRRNFTVSSLQRDTHLEALLLDLTHALERGGGAGDRSHVVVAHLLATSRELTGNGTASELKIRAAVVRMARHQEDFLLQTNVGVDGGGADVVAHRLEHALRLLVQSGSGAVKRRLLVEGIAVVRNETGRDEHGVFAQEDRRRRVDGKVTAGGVRRAHAAVRVRGTIRLPLEELFAREGVERGTIRREIKHRLVHLTRVTVTHTRGAHRLEPVAVHRGAVVHGPVEHRLGDDIRLRHILGPVPVREQRRRFAVFTQVLVRDRTLEASRPETFRRRRPRAHGQHRIHPRSSHDARLLRLTAQRARLRRQVHFLAQHRLFSRAPASVSHRARLRWVRQQLPSLIDRRAVASRSRRHRAFASSSRAVVDRASRRVSRRRSRTCCMFRRRTLGRRASKCRHARAIGRDRTFRGRHDTRDCRLSHDSWIFAYKNSKLAKKEKNFEFWTRPDSDARATTGARRRRRTRARRGEGRGR